jgi:ADP-heptose:LPS heptosyltransferase
VTPVLVARLDSVGDVLLAGPAIRAVAHGRRADGREPNDVVLLCGPQGEPAAALLPGVTEVYSWSCPWIVKPAPPVEQRQLDALRRFIIDSRITEAVILTSFHQSPLPLALQLRLAGVRRITGVSTDYAGSLLDIRLRPGEDLAEDQPEAERALAIASAAGFRLPPGDDGKLRITGYPDARELVGEEPYVVVHPGSSAAARAWPALHHAAAVELLEGAGHRVVVTGGPGETKLTATVAGPSAVDLGGRTDLKTLAGVLAHAEVLITGNTGPAHLAAALGTPVACLFSPVVPAIRWAPYGVPLELLGDQGAPCRLTRATECPVPGHPCLSSVGPEQLLEAVERLIGGVTSLSTRRKVRYP